MSLQTTARQAEILAFISNYIVTKGYSPSVKDIADHFGFASNAAQEHLNALERKSLVRRSPGVARSIRIAPQVAA
ncbi:MAG: LexA family protein [Janthinobacterium lividum]